MKVGCCAYSFRQYLTTNQITLEDFIRKAHAMGLDGVELTAYYFASTDPGYLNQLKRLAMLEGVQISGTAIGGAFAVADDPRAQHVAYAKQWVDITERLGAPWMRVFAGPIPEGATEETALAWAVEGLKEVADYAGAKGITLGLENHGGITGTWEQVKRLLDGVNNEWLRVNLDAGNYHRNGDRYQEMAETAPWAVNVHAKTEAGDGAWLDYPRIVQLLRNRGFKGYLSLEYEAAEDPMVAAPRFTAYLRSLVGW